VSLIEVSETDIPGLMVLRTWRQRDERGWFSRTYCAAELATVGFVHPPVQENQSVSRRGTVRGLHVRAELREAKFVRVTRGRLFDVVVDLRPASPTFLEWRSFVLTNTDSEHLLVPPGCAHGFQALSAWVDVHYAVDAPYAPDLDVTVAWNDPLLAIPWPLSNPVLSSRDRSAPLVDEVRHRLPEWFGAYRPDERTPPGGRGRTEQKEFSP
jgi:dTDP-4-dehydrorhamnose 3,5-epimerase